MKKTAPVLASFVIMLSLGGVYAFSIFVPELTGRYSFSSAGTQIVFGTLIAVFAATMIPAGRFEKKYGPRATVMVSAVFFTAGYITAGLSGGSFPLIFAGIGILAGIGTGFGYLAAIVIPVRHFPNKKGFVTGFVTAGFGLASVILSSASEYLLGRGKDVLEIFTLTGIVYGTVIFLMSFFLGKEKLPSAGTGSGMQAHRHENLLTDKRFQRLAAGIFSGTFAGLLVIGSLKSIGAEYGIENHVLVLGISVFAMANFTGRLAWGTLSDYAGTAGTIPSALLFQAAAIFLLGYLKLDPFVYLALSAAAGFGFGANFVLFARETNHLYGTERFGFVYPYVFLGYAAAGIFGPLTGGLIYDITGCYSRAKFIAAAISVAGAAVHVSGYLCEKKKLSKGSAL